MYIAMYWNIGILQLSHLASYLSDGRLVWGVFWFISFNRFCCLCVVSLHFYPDKGLSSPFALIQEQIWYGSLIWCLRRTDSPLAWGSSEGKSGKVELLVGTILQWLHCWREVVLTRGFSHNCLKGFGNADSLARKAWIYLGILWWLLVIPAGLGTWTWMSCTVQVASHYDREECRLNSNEQKSCKSSIKDNPVDSTSVLQRPRDVCAGNRLPAPVLLWI